MLVHSSLLIALQSPLFLLIFAQGMRHIACLINS
jgi:hypothetical protein